MAIRIVTDTASDLELEELKKYNITCVPMSISFGNESYKDIFELDRDSFYEKMIASKELPKTSQPSPADFIPCFSEAKRNGDQLIVILLCSLLSGTYQSAVIAKTEVDYDGIYIIDSRTVTCGERFLIEVAMKCIDEGMSAKEIAEHVESIKSRVKILACLETLDNLYKGGRLTRTQNIVVNVLNVKPVVTLTTEGEISIISKNRGINKSANWIVEQIAGKKLDSVCKPAALYSYSDQHVREFAAKCREVGIEIPENRFYNIGPTIGTHVGTGAFGIAYIEE